LPTIKHENCNTVSEWLMGAVAALEKVTESTYKHCYLSHRAKEMLLW